MLRNLCLLAAFALGFSVLAVQAQVQWQDADLSAIARGPNLDGNSRVAMTFDPAANLMRTHYVAQDQHMHELYLVAGRWYDADLTAIAGGPRVALAARVAMAFDPVANLVRTHYVAEDQHVHELYLVGIHWYDADLTAITSGPNGIAEAIAMAFDPASNVMRTHYVAQDRHVHELYLVARQWHDADLTGMGRPQAGSWISGSLIYPIVMGFDPVSSTMRTHYLASDDTFYELYLVAGQWQSVRLQGQCWRAGDAASFGLAMTFDPVSNGMRKHCLRSYRGPIYPPSPGYVDVVELFLSRPQWDWASLMSHTGVNMNSAIAMQFDPVRNGMRTHYVDNDGHVHELFLSGGRWQSADLTSNTGGPNAQGYGMAMGFDPVANGMRTHYVAADSHMHELFRSDPPAGAREQVATENAEWPSSAE